MLQFVNSTHLKTQETFAVSYLNRVFVTDSQDFGVPSQLSGFQVTEKETQVIHASFGKDSNQIFAATLNKMIEVWERDSSKDMWQFKSRITLKKKPMKIVIALSNKMAVVADKFGTVFGFSLEAPSNKTLKSLMGHVSTITDIILTKAPNLKEFLITCDHDEKIRVTNYPQTYDIEQFCLGHKGFVSQILAVPQSEILISAGGDYTIRTWNYLKGTLLDTFDCKISLTKNPDAFIRHLSMGPSNSFFALIEGIPRVVVFTIGTWPIGVLAITQEIDLLFQYPSSLLHFPFKNLFSVIGLSHEQGICLEFFTQKKTKNNLYENIATIHQTKANQPHPHQALLRWSEDFRTHLRESSDFSVQENLIKQYSVKHFQKKDYTIPKEENNNNNNTNTNTNNDNN